MKTSHYLLPSPRGFLLLPFLILPAHTRAGDSDAMEKVYALRPKADAPCEFGLIGPTGIETRIDVGVKVLVTGTRPGSPAHGKFEKNDVITGVNGKVLAGLNPYVVLGQTITAAEASDGRVVFEVESAKGKRQETVQIRVLGAYAKTWPRDCAKSRKIIDNAAAYYVKLLKEKNDGGMGGALACLYLLSTGDDRYLPLVRAHYGKMIANPKGVGEHTWNNGANGIACAEYYLRTGDQEILPVLQAICDDARNRQNFDSAWKHWGTDINPSYVSGGLMNPASAPLLTALLLSKEAGVDVDEKTLLNALRYFYRFAGHGSVAYGDHRAEGGIGSNGKDAMLAVAMQAASGASGDTTIYQMARDSLGMATLNSWPGMITGHADNGRGDGIWRGIASAYLIDKASARFRDVNDRISWWYDLSRGHDGYMGMATCSGWSTRDDSGGAGAMLLYTSPLKALRITGAPPSMHSKPFKLPENIWGRKADLDFLKITPVDGYESFGKEEPRHRIDGLFGSDYNKRKSGELATVPLEQCLRYIRHESYTVRAHVAKALRAKGEIKILEELLRHPDPRMRRAALDGILDWRFWSGGDGKEALAGGKYTPAMIETITAMLGNPEEALYVVDAALFAVGFMPADVIKANYKTIHEWSKHEDWWLRQGAFAALLGLQKEPESFLKVVPQLVNLMTGENHTMPRSYMNSRLLQAHKKFGANSEVGKLLAQGFDQSVDKTRILEGERFREGAYNIVHAIENSMQLAPDLAPVLAESLADRGLSLLDNRRLMELLRGRNKKEGLVGVLPKIRGAAKEALVKTLAKHYQPEVARRLKAGGGKDIGLIDTLIVLKEVGGDDAGWKVLGTPGPAERQWQYLSFDPIAEKDIRPKHERRRFRDVQLAPELKNWFKPEFDPKGWQTGKAPIGKGQYFRESKNPPRIASPWGDGEILLARTTFEITEDLGYDIYRLRVLCEQGFSLYLNGTKVQTYTWWQDPSEYASWQINPNQAKLLRKGANTLAICSVAFYPSSINPRWTGDVYGKVDVRIEGLKLADLY